jgi:FkbM family methyltransferase
MKNINTIIKKTLNMARYYFYKKRNNKICNALSKLPEQNGVTLIDIGAAGDIEPRWKRIQSFLNYVGFEPDERSRSMLLSKNNNKCLKYEILPFAVWDKEEIIEFNLCRSPGASSHFWPDQSYMEKFPDSQRFDVLRSINIKTSTLDNLTLESADFIKLDIQGGELNALIGGRNLLNKTLGLEIEVEFTSIYKKQPLFGEICKLMNEYDFDFIDFVSLCRWERLAHNSYGQCIFGDALFLRSPENMIKNHMEVESISKYLGICLNYNRFDLIDRMIELLPNDFKENKYLNFLLEIETIRKSNNLIRMLNRLLGIIFSVFGIEYKSHLMY